MTRNSDKIFKIVEGIKVDNLSGIFESYSIEKSPKGYSTITINISAQNIIPIFKQLAQNVKELGFLLIEVGTHQDIEKTLRKSDHDPFHKDVYYLDGMKWKDAEKIINQYEHQFSQDGLVNFGFGSHSGYDEVYVSSYKVFYIYANEPEKYLKALNRLKIPKVDRVKTVWSNFNHKSPGRRLALSNCKPTIWGIIERLKERGLYLAERRED